MSAIPETEVQKNNVRPYTGAEFIEDLKDDREVWIYGERVPDVTEHPAFRNPARMMARLYDALHNNEKYPHLRTDTDTGNGGFTHPYFKVAKSARGSDRPARSHCPMGPADLRLDGAHALTTRPA